MKNIIKISSLILALVLIGCDAIDDSRFQADRTSGWIEFEGDSVDALSTDGSVTIETEYNVPINRDGVTVTYDVQVTEGDAPGVETGTFTTFIEPDTADAPDIVFDIDPSIEGNYTVQYTIVSTSNPDVIVGLDGDDNPIVYTISVCNNDLPLSYSATTYFAADLTDPVETFDIVLVPTADPNEYSIANAWGNLVFELAGVGDGGFLYPVTLVRNSDNTVTLLNVSPSTNGAGELRYPGSAVPEEDDAIQNVFDPCTNQLSYVLDQNVFNGDFVIGVVLTPN